MEFHEFFESMDFSQPYADDDTPLKIIHKLTMSQNQLLTFVNDNKFTIIYKKRQEGVSSALAAYLLWLLINNDNYRIGMVSPSRSERENFRQLINMNLSKLEILFMKKGFDDSILTPENHNVNFTKFINGSSINYWTKNQPDAGRGHALDLVHISEMSYNDDYTRLINSMMISVMSSKNGKFIITTTDLSNVKDDLFMNGDGVNEYWMDSFSGTRFVIFEKIKSKSINFKI
jgi:hypothetical protein